MSGEKQPTSVNMRQDLIEATEAEHINRSSLINTLVAQWLNGDGAEAAVRLMRAEQLEQDGLDEIDKGERLIEKGEEKLEKSERIRDEIQQRKVTEEEQFEQLLGEATETISRKRRQTGVWPDTDSQVVQHWAGRLEMEPAGLLDAVKTESEYDE